MRKLTKLAAVVLSAVMTMSMAFAGTVTLPADMAEEDQYGAYVDVIKFVDDATKVDTISITFTADESGDPEKPIKGCFSIGAESNGWWSQTEYLVTNDNVTKNADGSYTAAYKLEKPLAATDTLAKFGAQIWDGDNMVITKIEFLDADGNKLTKTEAAPTAEPTKEAAKDDKTPEATKAPTTDKTPSQTGDATNVLALAAIACVALAGVAVSSKKRA